MLASKLFLICTGFIQVNSFVSVSQSPYRGATSMAVGQVLCAGADLPLEADSASTRGLLVSRTRFYSDITTESESNEQR